MATVKSVIERISRRLEDQESGYTYAHWKEVDLLAAANYALRIIGQYQPRQFGEMKTFDLPSDGMLHTECASFLPPYTLLDRAGQRIRNLATTEETASAWDMKLCTGKGGPLYLVSRAEREYEAHPMNRGDNYKVRGLCITIPTMNLDSQVPLTDDLVPVMDELMMYYAYSYDKTSSQYTGKGQAHWMNAMMLLGVTDGKR